MVGEGKKVMSTGRVDTQKYYGANYGATPSRSMALQGSHDRDKEHVDIRFQDPPLPPPAMGPPLPVRIGTKLYTPPGASNPHPEPRGWRGFDSGTVDVVPVVTTRGGSLTVSEDDDEDFQTDDSDEPSKENSDDNSEDGYDDNVENVRNGTTAGMVRKDPYSATSRPGQGGKDGSGRIAVGERGSGGGNQEEGSRRVTFPAPGGPELNDLLYGFGGHVASDIWRNVDRGVLGIQTRYDCLGKWSLSEDELVGLLVGQTGLSHLRDCVVPFVNKSLISAFVERWHPETNSFHMPFGEMTITLHDVFQILRIPVEGCPVTHDKNPNHVMIEFKHCFQLEAQDLHSELFFSRLREKCIVKLTPEFHAKGYLVHLLGATLFLDNLSGFFSPQFYFFLKDLKKVDNYAWGAAALAFLYRQLGIASRANSKQLSGFTSLLEYWIYEHFPKFRPYPNRQWSPDQPLAMRWVIPVPPRNSRAALLRYRRELDGMSPMSVVWTPYGRDICHRIQMSRFYGCLHYLDISEPYMPDRVLRQFGYVQTIPRPAIRPQEARLGPWKHGNEGYIMQYESYTNNWVHCLTHGNFGDKVAQAWETTPSYMSWFLPRTHPRLQNPAYVSSDPSHVVDVKPEAQLKDVKAHLLPLRPEMRLGMSYSRMASLVDRVVEAAFGKEQIVDNECGNRDKRKRKQLD